MDWNTLMHLPSTLLFVLAGCLGLFALVQLVAMVQHRRAGRPLAALLAFVLLVLGLGLGALFGGGGLALRGYRLLAEEAPVVQIDARILSPQRWSLVLTWPDGGSRTIGVAGDDFRVEAVVVKWRAPALLAGMAPLYRLDRIDGRYDDATQETQSPRTAIDFKQAGAFDLIDLRKRYPRYLPLVDTVFGSGAYLPLVDQGHYTVSLMRSGALVARPDAATEQRIAQPL